MAYELRPLSIGELLDRTFSLYRRHFWTFFGIVALANLLPLAIQLATIVALRGAGLVQTSVVVLSRIFVSLIAVALSQCATVVAVSQTLLNRKTSIAEAFQSVRLRLGELIVVMLNMTVRIVLGLILLVIPGILLALRYALTIPVAVLEQEGPSRSLSRSARLTKGHRGRIFLIYFLLSALIAIVTMVWQAPLMLTMVLTGQPAASSTLGLATLLLGTFLTQSVLGPILTIGLTLVYYDERVRKEAFDLEHMMGQLDHPADSISKIS